MTVITHARISHKIENSVAWGNLGAFRFFAFMTSLFIQTTKSTYQLKAYESLMANNAFMSHKNEKSYA